MSRAGVDERRVGGPDFVGAPPTPYFLAQQRQFCVDHLNTVLKAIFKFQDDGGIVTDRLLAQLPKLLGLLGVTCLVASWSGEACAITASISERGPSVVGEPVTFDLVVEGAVDLGRVEHGQAGDVHRGRGRLHGEEPGVEPRQPLHAHPQVDVGPIVRRGPAL